MDELLVKYLLNEMTEDERVSIEDWLQSNPENQKKLDHFKILWSESKKLESKSNVDENEAWNKFSSKIHGTKGLVVVRGNRNRLMRLAAVAALVIVFLSAGIYFYLSGRFSGNMEQIAFQANDTVITQLLSDGSEIVLNKQSSLQYQNNPRTSTREVKLKGEAFFTVAPDKSRPFVISIDSVEVRVVGTSFNVKGTAAGVEVIVETGIVEVSSNGKKLVLNPGEKTLISYNSVQVTKEANNNQLYKYFRTKEFLCDNTPLWQLVEVVNEAYGSNIRIEDSTLRQLPISASFNNQSLETILEVIEKTFQIRVETQGDSILLKK